MIDLVIIDELALLSQTLAQNLISKCISKYDLDNITNINDDDKIKEDNHAQYDDSDNRDDSDDNIQDYYDFASLKKSRRYHKYNMIIVEESGLHGDNDDINNDLNDADQLSYKCHRKYNNNNSNNMYTNEDNKNNNISRIIEENIITAETDFITSKSYDITNLEDIRFHSMNQYPNNTNHVLRDSTDHHICHNLGDINRNNHNHIDRLLTLDSNSSMLNHTASRDIFLDNISCFSQQASLPSPSPLYNDEHGSFINQIIQGKSACNKEGWLYKKTTSIFLGWQKRYFKLKYPRIYYGKTINDIQNKKNVRCINIEAQPCKLIEESGLYFNINIINTNKKLKLKAFNENDAKEWRDALRNMFEYLHKKQSFGQYMAIKEEKSWKIDQITEEELLKVAKTGDILLFKSHNFIAKVQRAITLSDYDHVGMILNDSGSIYIFDSVGNQGVGLTPWEIFVQAGVDKAYDRIVYRKLEITELTQQMISPLYDFIATTSGSNYCFNLRKLLKRNSIIHTIHHENHHEPKIPIKKEGYFCSELIAAAYKTLGLMNTSKSSSQFWPIDFSSKRTLPLIGGAKLGPEMMIVLKKNILAQQ